MHLLHLGHDDAPDDMRAELIDRTVMNCTYGHTGNANVARLQKMIFDILALLIILYLYPTVSYHCCVPGGFSVVSE